MTSSSRTSVRRGGRDRPIRKDSDDLDMLPPFDNLSNPEEFLKAVYTKIHKPIRWSKRVAAPPAVTGINTPKED